MPILHIKREDGSDYKYNLSKEETVIGRNEDNDVVIPNHIVSRHHAVITNKKNKYFLKDLGSYNGTQVNGKFIQNVRLKPKDEISVGPFKLVFLFKDKLPEVQAGKEEQDTKVEFGKWDQKIAQSIPAATCVQPGQDILATLEIKKGQEDSLLATLDSKPSIEIQAEITSLERMNKVLFVLYEISRQLNTIHDFNELLQKIMDLLFMVINADFGFLILTEQEVKDEIIPVVIKSKKEHKKTKVKLSASKTIINKVIRDKVALLTSNAMADSRFAHAQSIMQKGIKSAMCVPLWEKDEIIGVIQLDSIRLDNQFTQDDLELLNAIGCQMAMVIAQARLNEKIREEEQMRDRLERFHSPQVIDVILKSNHEKQDYILEARELNATILFTDIVKFTNLSEQMPPRNVNILLNRHFSLLTDVIFEYDGTLDKYLGDGLMAVFGAPFEKKDDAERAVLAARKIRSEYAAAMEESGSETKFDIRIGINTGRVVAGNIGSPRRLDYTVIGDTVNTASRLESIGEPNQILIGEETYKQVKGKFKTKKLGPQKLKGKREKIMVYEILD
jgi:adenylate cyclase